MRFAFTRDQELLRGALRDVLEKQCAPAVVRAAWSGESSAALWKTLAEVGVVGLTAGEAHGGLGMGALEAALLLEECGRFAAPVPLLETMGVAVPLLQAAGRDDVAGRWLPAIVAGEARAAVGFAGGPHVSAAEGADLFLLTQGGELHAVPREGVTLEREPSVDGARRLARVGWTPRDETRMAHGEAAERLVAEAFDRGALGAAAELLGLARKMIDLAVDYAKVRKQFGAPIGSFQAVKHHLAGALGKVEFARPAVYRAADSIDRADAARSLHVSMAKACASDAAGVAARAALQCHGAIGYSFEHDLHLWMKRAWALAAAWGDASWHRERVAKKIIGQRVRAELGSVDTRGEES